MLSSGESARWNRKAFNHMVSALFSKEHFSRTWYAGWAQAVTAAVFTSPCEMHASSAVGVLGVSVVLIM